MSNQRRAKRGSSKTSKKGNPGGEAGQARGKMPGNQMPGGKMPGDKMPGGKPDYPLLEAPPRRGLGEAAAAFDPVQRLERNRAHLGRLRDYERRRRAASEARGPIDFRAGQPALENDRGPALERIAGQIPDAEGRPGSPIRAYDTLAALRRNGTIEEAALTAGRRFEEDFRLAGLNSLHARDLSRMGGGGRSSGSESVTDLMLAGRQRVQRVLEQIGGMHSLPGSVLWAVLGEGRTIKEFAEASQLGTAGRSLDQKTAKGVLVCALSTLAALYGFPS